MKKILHNGYPTRITLDLVPYGLNTIHWGVGDILSENYQLDVLKAQKLNNSLVLSKLENKTDGYWLLTVSKKGELNVHHLLVAYPSQIASQWNKCSTQRTDYFHYIHNMVFIPFPPSQSPAEYFYHPSKARKPSMHFASLMKQIESLLKIDGLTSVEAVKLMITDGINDFSSTLQTLKYHYRLATNDGQRKILLNKINTIQRDLYLISFNHLGYIQKNYTNKGKGNLSITGIARKNQISLNYHNRNYSSINLVDNSTVNSNDILLGCFIIKLSNISVLPKVFFFFYNNNSKQITKFYYHEGRSYYKEFGIFILNTLKDLNEIQNKNYYILLPKNYINGRLISIINNVLGIDTVPYTWSGIGVIPREIINLNLILNATSLSPNLKEEIDNINSSMEKSTVNVKHNLIDSNPMLKDMLKTKKSDGGNRCFHSSSLNHSKKKDGSSIGLTTKGENKLPKDLKDKKDISIFQVLGLDPSKVIIQKTCEIDNKPIKWQKGEQTYFIAGKLSSLSKDTAKEIVSNFKPGGTYSVMPILYDKDKPYGQQHISLSRQVLLTDAIDPDSLYNFLEYSTTVLADWYDCSDLDGDLIFRIVPVSMSPSTYRSVTASGLPSGKPKPLSTDSLNNRQNNVLITAQSRDRRQVKSTSSYLTSRNITNLATRKSNLIGITPLTTDLTYYGEKIFSGDLWDKLKGQGECYKYTENILLLVHNDSNSPPEKIKGMVLRKVSVYKDGEFYFEFIDIFNNSSNIFTREQIGVSSLIDKKKQKILSSSKPLNPLYIKVKKASHRRITRISTFDIETYIGDDGIFTPYACGWHNGFTKVNKNYYVTDYDSVENMLSNALEDLNKSDPGTVYVHNLSRFDSFFILRILYKDFKIKPLYKDMKILQLDVSNNSANFNYKAKRMVFKDSFLLLPDSLKRLAKSFKTSHQKGYFPYDFVNEENLNYIGHIPNYKYFKEQLSLTEYEEIKNTPEGLNWDLKKETLKYLSLDTITLWEILEEFSKDVWNESVNITKCTSTSGLAFTIFKTNYLRTAKLSMVKGIAHANMREAYYGGRTEVFKPRGKNLTSYDCNSIYSHAMLKDMPVGAPSRSNDPNLYNYFGVIKAKLRTIKNVKYPFIPLRNISHTGLIFPLGNWEGWYFSEELKYALESGIYDVEVIEGYKYDRGVDVFKDYVNKFYGIKAGTVQSPMGRVTSKLLLNGLFGRLGMDPHATQSTLIKEDELPKFIEMNDVIDFFPVIPGFEFVRYRPKPIYHGGDVNPSYYSKTNRYRELEQSVQISIATTAYARMWMNDIISYVTNEMKRKIYMTDTDCIWIDGHLPSKFIGSEIGMFKEEFRATEAIFPAPKLYYAINKEGVEIKKSKGVKSGSLSREDYEALDRGETLSNSETRFGRSFREQEIRLITHVYTIKPNFNKRIPIFKEGLVVDTKPIVVKDGIPIISN